MPETGIGQAVETGRHHPGYRPVRAPWPRAATPGRACIDLQGPHDAALSRPPSTAGAAAC